MLKLCLNKEKLIKRAHIYLCMFLELVCFEICHKPCICSVLCLGKQRSATHNDNSPACLVMLTLVQKTCPTEPTQCRTRQVT